MTSRENTIYFWELEKNTNKAKFQNKVQSSFW